MCVHTNSRIRGSGRIQHACHRSGRKKTAVSRMWKKHEISLQKSMEFPIQSHLWLTSAWRGYISMSIDYITMEWRGQQHASKAVESTASSATAAINSHIISSSRIKKKMEESTPDRM